MRTQRTRLPRRRSDVALRDHVGHSVLVAPASDEQHVLNPTARAIWELCDGATTIDELADAICAVFDVRRDVAVADVKLTIERFAAADLLDLTTIQA
jgi:hypothetical protein